MTSATSTAAGDPPARPATSDPLPRCYSTPESRTGGTRWPDLHQLCNAPGYRDRVLGWVRVPCGCDCHEQAAS